MAIGDRIRIVTEEEYRIMSPPRRPRGEKPQTTIRWQRRQMQQMAERIGHLAAANESLEKDVARHDVEKSEIETQLFETQHAAERQMERYLERQAEFNNAALRLAFLEGYYAKSTESAGHAHDPGKTYRGSGPGNPENLPHGAQTGEAARQEAITPGARRRTRVEIRSSDQDDLPRQEGRPLERSEIIEAVRDGITRR